MTNSEHPTQRFIEIIANSIQFVDTCEHICAPALAYRLCARTDDDKDDSLLNWTDYSRHS